MRHKYLLSLVLLLALTENILMNTVCRTGEKMRKGKCVDDDECESDPSICGRNATCFNTNGSYYCQCHEGFTPPSPHNFTQTDAIVCQDFNECLVGSDDCGPNTTCVNTEGGFNCTCATGYISSNGKDIFNSGVQCTDRDECKDPSFCGKHASCHNTAGGFYCICEAGFRLKSGGTNFTNTSELCDSRTNSSLDLMSDVLLTVIKASQPFPEFTNLASLMTNISQILNQSEPVRMKDFTKQDGKRFLQAFQNALDDLLRGGFSADSAKVSALFSIVESMLKLIGHQQSESPTRRESATTDVELLVMRGNSPPEGDFMMKTSGAQLTSHWETATGNTYLGFTTTALLSYNGLEKSLDGFFDHLETQKNETFKINSKVVTATVSNKETNNLTTPVNFTFYHLEISPKEKNEKQRPVCVFWDPELDGGAWSTRGCTTVSFSPDRTNCSCNHLSSFAVLMALYDIGDVYELRVITLVGLSLSLICFLICIVTFYFVRSIQSTRNTIHLHLCISLFIAYFVFLVGISRTENEVGCSVVAGILHYFFLASFCWMCLEGVQLFRMVVLVFNTTLRPVYMFAAGYGVPAVIVAISASVNASGYGTEEYCWLNIKDGFIWSFYGPVCVIIIVNVLFFLITISKLAEKFSSLNPDLDSLHKIKAFTITAIAQLCILGIMWVFGCFQFNENTVVMSYIFTILSSLQGVLMFIMHCWLAKQVREEYAKFLSCICTPHKRKYSEFTSNQSSKPQASRSDTHTGESHI